MLNKTCCAKCNFFLVLILIIYSINSYSQSETASYQFLIFDDIYHGGRSLGMGGTSIAIGGDFSNAEKNPANLILVPRSLIEIDISYSSFTRSVYNSESIFSNTVPSFFGAALNYGSLAFGFFQRTMYKVNEKYSTNNFALPIDLNLPDLNVDRDLSVTLRGFSVSILLTNDIAFGIGFRKGNLKFESNSYRKALLEEVDYDFTNSFIDVSDSDSSWSFGVLFNPKQKFSFALSYNMKLSYHIKETQRYFLSSQLILSELKEYQLNVPKRLNMGFGYDFGKVKLALDMLNVYYSNLLKDGMQMSEIKDGAENFVVKDIKEFHFGIEIPVTIAKSYVLSFRGGCQYIPFHGIKYVGTSGNLISDNLFSNLYPKGDSEFGISFGAGLNIKSLSFVDAGFMFSSERKSIVITGGVCF